MSKPKKERFVSYPPPAALFRPIGIPSSQLCQVALLLDEYEALRLVDHEGMDQARAAAELGISRATCARILESAHRKVADAMVNGCAIRIEGGHYRFRRNRFRCLNCGTMWESGFEEASGQHECPECEGPNIVDLAARVGRHGGSGSFGRRGGQASGGRQGGRGSDGPWSEGPHFDGRHRGHGEANR
jgi:predicted DNA-binding protein (UPF0251 family)